jgi:hypothetical protein
LKRRGVFGTLRLALLKAPRRVAGWLWDRRHGVETARIAELDDLDIPSDNVAYGIRYQPTPTGAFRRVIRNLGIRCDQYNFIDFGSGKGRTLLLASELPFRNVIGVEFAPQLHKVAEENIRSFRGRQRCRQIQSICRDAALYRLPPGNSVLFFNFPFHEPVMRSVLAAIHESVRGSRAEIIIVNYEPTPSIARLFEGNTAFTMVRQSRECAVYRSTPRHDWGPPATALDAHAHGGS